MASGSVSLPEDHGRSWSASLRQLFRSNRGLPVLGAVGAIAGLVLSATLPVVGDSFTFLDLFISRILLTLVAIPLGYIAARYSQTRFNLANFRLNPPPGQRRFNWTSKWTIFVGTSIFLGVVFYFWDPIEVYAQARSKALVTLFYVTDRNIIPSQGAIKFSNEISDPPAIGYGIATVPVRWTRADVVRNLRSKVPLSRTVESRQLQDLSHDAFFSELQHSLAIAPKRDAFVFVHGFHNPFDSAIDTTARLSYDLKFQGATILYSWPSGDEISSYDHDYENANLSVPDLAKTLQEIRNISTLNKLDLIAHSMGTRVLSEAIGTMDVRMPFANQLVLAAADIGEPEFSRQYDALSRSANHTTIYVSRWDGALAASSKLHKGGRVGLNPVSRGTMDVVDTNGLDTSLLDVNHGYLFDSQPVLYDLYEIIEDDKAPERRAALHRDDGACCWSFDHR